MAVGVKVEDVSKIFPPNTIALKDVRFEIKPGEFFVILGPSGSGKTTLLRIIAGLEVPSKGRIIFGDRVIVDAEKGVYVEPRERNIGMVFQNWALYSHMTAYDNIAYPLKLKKLPRDEIDKRVKEVAEALGIRELLHRKPAQLSGGQQQRVALARALVKQPDILLLDEPFSNLDARVRVTAREFVKEVQRKLGITSILVTHDQADAFAVGDRILVLRNGVVQQVGSREELYDNPVNLFVANFIGDPPMNIVELSINHPLLETLGLKKFVSESSRVYLGVRPDEALAVVEKGKAHATGVVTLIEYLGSRKYCRIETPDGLALKVLAGDNISEGMEAGIYIKKLHLFQANGERITTINL